MKKIVLCGATHGSNFGDTVFAIMFYEYLIKRYPNYEFRFTEVSPYTENYIDVQAVDKNYLKESEGLIFISGGYFGESHNETIRGSIKRYQKYFKYGKYFVKNNKKIAISGVGAGPLNQKYLRKVAVSIFNHATSISVRDVDSANNMKQYGVRRKMEVTSDSAQYIESFNLTKLEHKEQISKIKIDQNKKYVLLHISEAIDFEFYQETVLKKLVKVLPKDTNLIISNDVTGNTEILEKTQQIFNKFETQIYYYDNPVDFINLIKSVDSVITPKLHVGIFASTFNKAVLSFPLHPEKTLRYYDQIGYPENSISLFDVTDENIEKMVNQLLWKPIDLKEEYVTKAKKNFELLDEFILNL